MNCGLLAMACWDYECTTGNNSSTGNGRKKKSAKFMLKQQE